MAERTARSPLRFVGWVVAALVVLFVARALARQLVELRAHPIPAAIDWGLVAASGAVFLCAHAVLVQTWRSMLACWDAHLPFWSAARVWSVSNLGRYLPGKIWQIGAMGAMARDLGISPLAASGSAVLGTLVNIIAGFIVALLGGRALLEQASSGRSGAALVGVVVAVVALIASPFVLPRLTPLVGRVIGRPLQATLPLRAVVYALIGNVTAWLLYGAAFQLFTTAILGRSGGGYLAFLATYTISYLAGYLFLPAPAGLGVREGAMMTLMTYAGLATGPEAALVAISSRVWLTLLEVVPGFLFWALASARRRPPTPDVTDVPT